MISSTRAETLLQQGDLPNSIQALQQSVRETPSEARLRVFLFQLLCVSGEWQRAAHQLDLSGELDAEYLPLVHMYRAVIDAESHRFDVFAGDLVPTLFGEPPAWIPHLIEALRLSAAGDSGPASQLRQMALEQAPAVPGRIDDRPFDWIADADSRLGPVLEAFIGGQYYWIPMQHLRRIEFETPNDLRDLVWLPARLEFENSANLAALIPSRYPGTESSETASLKLGRQTCWEEPSPGCYCGQGQRMLATDSDDYPMLEIRQISFGTTPAN
jgi:type VI secretion system protein ImpE